MSNTDNIYVTQRNEPNSQMEKSIETSSNCQGQQANEIAEYTTNRGQQRSQRRPIETTSTGMYTERLNSRDVSSFYIDVGDCDWACDYCGAVFWYGERLKKSTQTNVRYSQCCGEGKVRLQQPIDPPDSIKQLMKDKHFLDNIRAYNQMFSMTSFGAQIDDRVNDGRRPYVFKISGQIYHWIGTLCPPTNEALKFLQLYIYDTKHEVENRLEPFSGTRSTTLKPQIVQELIEILDEHNQLVALFRTARDICNQENVPDFKIHLYNVDRAREYQLPTADILGGIVFEDGLISIQNMM